MNDKTSKRMTAAHLRRLDLAIRNWELLGEQAAGRGDTELASTYAMDAADLKAIRDAYARGDLDSARSMIDSLDTLVRDQIPLQLYYHLFPNR
ncbi:MAG: hypothetical protein BWX88_05057 [Planctomycetes bacterium ADurb.Bin126]|nr:MAG: hypothetical protein BWX88_05057 [Planctomycetes bacterium ADurb.Bin126]HOD84529.1 hypothetical protein [Phycisphaerae bacterium]HQL76317.1 hypothetical protein [Phycisphaerae bacterium]